METIPGYEEFASQANTHFTVRLIPAGQTVLELITVSERKTAASFENYSLLFRGAPDILLQQQTHHLSHEKLGEFLLFLVPVGKDAGGYLYEAVFNSLIKDES